MVNINEILKRIIDVKKSVIDAEKSNPARGQFKFKKCVYYTTKGKHLRECPYYFAFCRMDKEGLEPSMWTYDGWEFVTKDDDFIPDGVAPNAEGHYQVADVVLMRKPMGLWLKARLDRCKQEDQALKARDRQFREQAKKEGMGLEGVDEEDIARNLGIIGT